MSQKAYRIITAFTWLIALGLLGWAAWPLPADQSQVFLRPDFLSLPQSLHLPPGAVQPRILVLTWPRVVRLGDSGRITLDVLPDPASSTTLTVDGVQPNLMVDARLEIPDARLLPPPGLVSQTLLTGQSLHFEWRVAPYRATEINGVAWVYYRFVVSETGQQEQVLVAVKPVQMQVVSLAGLSAGVVRAAGWVGVVLGVILSFPLVDGVLRRFWGFKNMTKIMKINYKG